MKAEDVLALVGGHVDEELLLRNEYLTAEDIALEPASLARWNEIDSGALTLVRRRLHHLVFARETLNAGRG